MQGSLLHLLYNGISIGSHTCRILYYTCYILESQLGLLHAGFSFTPPLQVNLYWESPDLLYKGISIESTYTENSLVDHGHKGISFGTATCRIPYLTSYIRPTMYVKSSLSAPLYGDSHMFTWPKAHMPSCPCTQTDGLTCIHAYSLVPTCIGTMIYSSRSLLCPLRRPPHTQKKHAYIYIYIYPCIHMYIYIYIYICSLIYV